MSSYPPPYPPPPGSPYAGGPQGDWRYQRRLLKEQARARRDMLRAQRDAFRFQMRAQRRGSIVGPLLAVGIGVVFLLVQMDHRRWYSVGTLFGRWWPIIFVAVGVILLAEWAFDQWSLKRLEPGQLVPGRRAMGGGAVMLLILLGLAGVGASATRYQPGLFAHGFTLNEDNLEQLLGDKHESEQTLVQPFAAGASLTIDNPRGDVTVSGTSDDNQVHIALHKEVYSRSDSDAEQKVQQLNPKVTASGSNTSISIAPTDGGHADLTITVPSNAALTVNADHGDVRVNSLKAAVSVTANRGDVEISAITGPVSGRVNNGSSSFSAHSVTGPVSVEGRGHDLTVSDITGPVKMNGEFYGATHLEHIRGPIQFHTSRTDFQLARLDGEVEISPHADLSADGIAGPVMLNTRNRNITLERISGDLQVTNRNGSIDLTSAPPLGNVSVENRNGSVNVTVPERADFSVHAETTNGDVGNDFALPEQGDENHKNFAGTVGKGGSSIRIVTSHGDVSLKRASIAPLPPLPPPAPLTFVPPQQRDREDIEDARREAREAAADAQREAKEAIAEAKRTAKEAADQAKQAAKEAADQARQAQKERAAEQKERAAEQKEARRQSNSQ